MESKHLIRKMIHYYNNDTLQTDNVKRQYNDKNMNHMMIMVRKFEFEKAHLNLLIHSF